MLDRCLLLLLSPAQPHLFLTSHQYRSSLLRFLNRKHHSSRIMAAANSNSDHQDQIKAEQSSSDHLDHGPQGKYDYGGNPLVHAYTEDGQPLFSAFGGAFQPGLYKPPKSQIGNPVPLGLSGFALTTFLLSCINLGTRDLATPSLVIGPAFAYGGLIQLLAGMWDMAIGNTFGGTALSSYGGFWISIGIILTPGGFQIEDSYGDASNGNFYAAFGL